MTELVCPDCGRKLPEDANFCLSCGTRTTRWNRKDDRSALVTAGSVLATVAASLLAISSITGITMSALYLSSYRSFYRYEDTLLAFYNGLLVWSAFAMISFSIGLAACVQCSRRRTFQLVVGGMSLMLLATVSSFALVASPHNMGFFWGLIISPPILFLLLLATIFTAVKYKEFH